MPRSFLITKLQKWKDSDVAEDEIAFDDDEEVDVSTGCFVDDGDLTTPVPSLSTKLEDVVVTGRAYDGNSLANFIGMSTKAIQQWCIKLK